MSSSATKSPYKPSNLSYNSPRTSPFRRPESPFVTRSPSAISATTPFVTAPIEQPRTYKSTKNDSNDEDHDIATAVNSPLLPPPRYSQQQQQRPDSSSSSYFGEVSPLKGFSGHNSASGNNNYNNNTDTAITPVASLNTGNNRSSRPLPTAPTPATSTSTSIMPPNTNPSLPSDPLSRLAPQYLLPMREAFSILDRSNTGTVTRADIADMLRQLGMDSSAGSVDAFFQPPQSTRGSNNDSKGQGITLPAFLATLSALLPQPGTASELTAAFAAFDDTDAGQADWTELRDVLVKEVTSGGGVGDSSNITTSEVDAVMDMFKGRRAFGSGNAGAGAGTGRGLGGKVGGGGDSSTIFRYHDFVAAVTGGNGNGNGNGNGGANGNGNGNGNGNSGATARVRA